MIKKILSKPIIVAPKSNVVIEDESNLNDIITQNRATLKGFSKWLTREDWQNAYYWYGVPEEIFSLLDLEIGDEVVYTDLMAYYAKQFRNVHYLELGVSVGKNFMQLANFFQNSVLTGFDIENINPTIREYFSSGIQQTWKTKKGSLRKELSYFNTYSYKTNTVNYLAGDIWDEESWKRLKGSKFNIIFSDALHDPNALLWEYEMIKKYDLLADEFMFFWDDLNNGLDDSFKLIAADLIKRKIIVDTNVFLIKINGWLGKNYPIKHDVGILSTFNLK